MKKEYDFSKGVRGKYHKALGVILQAFEPKKVRFKFFKKRFSVSLSYPPPFLADEYSDGGKRAGRTN